MLSPPKQTRLPPEMGQEIKKLMWNLESPLAALEKSSMPNQCKKQSKIMSLLFFVTVNSLVMSSSWNFPAQAEPSYEDSEPSRAGALQFLS